MTDKTCIIGKDRDLESSIDSMQQKLHEPGVVEEVSWLNPVSNVCSVHIALSSFNLKLF